MDDRCAFRQTLIGDDFGCVRAQHVVRRGGPDVACTDPQASRRCAAFYEHIKQVVLPALGYADDLLTTPHSVLVKLEYGGLLGTRRAVQPQAPADARIDDIDALLGRAEQLHGLAAGLPSDHLIAAAKEYKVRRRR